MIVDELELFKDSYLAKAPIIGYTPLNNVVRDIFGIYGYTQFSQGDYQVQVFVVPPHKIIPEHTHPNVDSFEVYLGGQILFSHSGKWLSTNEQLTEMDENKCSVIRGTTVRVKPNDLHGGCFGPAGGVFMSIQKWLNGVKPSCVSFDYDGIALDEDHKVEYGEIEHKELTWRDAASLENISPFWEK